MRYYIADLHFHHDSLNQNMDCRGFENGEAMNEYMIQRWNSKVRPQDEVVILGDFSISANGEEVNKVLRRLQGKKYLVKGNHDRYLDSRRFDSSLFLWIEDYKEMHDNKRKVVLSHYPMLCYNGQYRRNAKGESETYMLYGHVHDTLDEKLIHSFQKQIRECKRMVLGAEEPLPIPCQMINCFCMFSDYTPLSLDEWIEADRQRRSRLSD